MQRTRSQRSLLLLTLCCAARSLTMPSELPADGAIVFPGDGGVLNVVDFGATPDDGIDDTGAIQQALDEHPNGNRIVYLPAGEYLVSDTIRWPAGASGGDACKRTILQGAGEEFTTIRLPDATAGFSNAETEARPIIWTGSAPAQRFRNAIRDLTVHTGAGNPGAIGIQFNASNQGTITNVSIISGDRQGLVGLDLGHTNEIGPLLVRNLTVEGFDEGIRTWWPVNSCTFEHITLRQQNVYGWHNYHQMVFVRGLHSENSVPAIFNRKDSWGTVALIDSEIIGLPGAEATCGILNERQIYIRNTSITGYGIAIDNADKGRDKGDVFEEGLVVEDTSHANVVSLYSETNGILPVDETTALDVPVSDTPVVAWGHPETDWVNIVDFGADPTGEADSSDALQRAIDSGAATVFLPGGSRFRFSREVRVRGNVSRIIGLEGRCVFEEGSVWRLVDGEAGTGREDAPVVVFERCMSQSGGRGIPLIHESSRTLVVSSWTGMHVIGRGSGDIFLDDFCGKLDLESPQHHCWCRQLNTEHDGTMLTNNGAYLWILGMKTERIGTIIHTRNGGITDLAGCFVYSNRGWEDGVPAFLIEDSRVRLAGLNERHYGDDPVSLWFRERRNNETRELQARGWVYIGY